jgi:hypothetical protein
MNSMASAAWTKFLNGKLFGLALFVFAGHVVAPFAPIALKTNKIPHFRHSRGKRSPPLDFTKPTMGIGPMTSSLPRKCSAD